MKKPQSISNRSKNNPLQVWNETVTSCTRCPLHAFNDRRIAYRYSHGPYSYGLPVHILFVGEGPGESEYLLREPFKGASGHELNYLIDSVITNPSIRYLITNSVLCTPWTDASLAKIGTPSVPEVRACGNNLKALLAITKPVAVVALGQVASRALKKLVPSYKTLSHPSAILRSTHPEYERQRFILGLQSVLDTLI